MGAVLLKGRETAVQTAERLKAEVLALTGKGGTAPVLGLVQIGGFKDAALYAKSIRRVMDKLGITVRDCPLEAGCGQTEAEDGIRRLAATDDITGILVLSPVPSGLAHDRLTAAVPAHKDAEGAHPAEGAVKGVYPPTALSIMELIRSTGMTIEGREAVVVGRSPIVGRPAARLLIDAHATVTICHSRTRKLESHVARADILVAAAGRAGLIRGSWIKPGAVVIDAAENVTDKGVTGDVEFEAAAERAGFITPVPGGVGPLTTYMLARNLLTLHRNPKGNPSWKSATS